MMGTDLTKANMKNGIHHSREIAGKVRSEEVEKWSFLQRGKERDAGIESEKTGEKHRNTVIAKSESEGKLEQSANVVKTCNATEV